MPPRPGPGAPALPPGERRPSRVEHTRALARGGAMLRAMSDGLYAFPPPVNEPVLSYAKGTKERARLVAELERTAGEVAEIPVALAGEHVTKDRKTSNVVMP